MKLDATWILVGCAGLWALATPAAAQCQTQKLVASDPGQGDYFGWSVSVSGTTALISAFLEDSVVGPSGAVYVFEQGPAGWTEVQKLKASDAAFGMAFGHDVGISGDWAVVAALTDSPQGIFAAGSAYVFQRQNGVWIETQKLVANDAKPEDHFGWSVAIRGGRLVCGARDVDHLYVDSGASYVYELQGSTWVEAAKLTPSDPEVYCSFGEAVAIDGDLALVGAPSHDNGVLSAYDFGAAYLFQRTGGGWVQQQKLVASDPLQYDFFAMAVALEGTTVMAGSTTHPNQNGLKCGVVYVFEPVGGTWVEVQQVVPADPEFNLFFGHSIDISAGTAVVSTPIDNDQGYSSGSAYAFRKVNGAWVQIGKMLALDGHSPQSLGNSAAVEGDLVLAGAALDDALCPGNPSCVSGAAYVFKLAPDAVQYCFCGMAGPCANHDDFGGCKNSSGQGAVLSACGSSSVATDDLVLHARWLPSNVLGILFMGGTNVGLPFGDGLLCVASGGAGVYRFVPPQGSGPGGTMSLGPGIAALTQATNPPAGQIAPGQIWNFQCWFRDPTGPCASSFNLSNAVHVVFGP